MRHLNISQILEHLPHRFPFLLVDRVIELKPEKSLVAIKNVTINEPFFAGHFPVKPVMPGVLIVEALAQAACVLASFSVDTPLEETLFYLGSIENARFRKMVIPGDQLYLKIEVLKRKARVWKFSGTALVDNEVVCTAEMTSAEARIEVVS